MDEAGELRQFGAQPFDQQFSAGEFSGDRHEAHQQFGAFLGGTHQEVAGKALITAGVPAGQAFLLEPGLDDRPRPLDAGIQKMAFVDG